MIQQIKELRVRIDGLHQLTKELKPIADWIDGAYIEPFEQYSNSNEIEESVKSLILAKAWLGKLLGELGSENPYSSGKKEVKDIEPTADTSDRDVKAIYDGSWSNESHIERVDWLRSEIQKVIDEVVIIEPNTSIARLNAYNHLCEAKMWLGFEFARIKQE